MPRNTTSSCTDSDSCCAKEVTRRAFLEIGAGAALAASAAPVMAGPFEANEYQKAIPTDKKLDANWVASLTARGQKETYSDPQSLERIGMPVGGFFAGTVYLSGDGRLWLWEIFNRDQTGILPREAQLPEGIGVGGNNNMRGLNYLSPAPLTQPFHIDFSLTCADRTRRLDHRDWQHVTFEGRYPIGRIRYQDDDAPVDVQLEAFSPFIPLNLADSSLPATLMSYRLTNRSDSPIRCNLTGRMENAVCIDSKSTVTGKLVNRIVADRQMTSLDCSAGPLPRTDASKPRPDILVDDFERPVYERWTAEGSAFGTGPVARTDIPDYQGDVGGEGKRVVNSHAAAPGGDVRAKDGQVGTLTSQPFTIERKYLQFFVGGGSHKNKTCVNLLIDGKTVASATGRDNNRMARTAFNLSRHAGRRAQLQLVDSESGGWGNIGIDHIVQTDRPLIDDSIDQQRDFGTMTLSLLDSPADNNLTAADVSDLEDTSKAGERRSASADLSTELIGQLGTTISLAPGESRSVTFAVTWHFPNFRSRGVGGSQVGHWYGSQFDSALSVAQHLTGNLQRFVEETRRWVQTWYDSTLPYWFLDRTMATTSTLATTTCYRFKDGRFWAWEGIGCCAGTCTHVWHYAQAPGRLFPELERIERERVNFGIGQHSDGGIGMRTDLTRSNHHADDGHCGRVIGALREHMMSADDSFLRRLWPKIKAAIQFEIDRDGNSDGLLEGAQPNTLDADWFGKISFISSLYLAMLKAGRIMAEEMKDNGFARQCEEIASRGAESILETYNGEYFVQIEDPAHKDKIGVGSGCYIDQIFGQTWAHWVGLDTLFDRGKQLSALRALWKYNFVPDVGPFREHFQAGRWYAMAGDAGLIMCSWPKGGKNPAFAKHWQYGYFNECMTGFEYQAAAHMVWEGIDQPDLLQNGLAVTRAIHDRYRATLRNPYNEIECSDHYSRAMAGYGVFQAVCGYQCHGPLGRLEFAPRVDAHDFRAPFVAPEGWGSYEQSIDGRQMTARVAVHHGRQRMKTLVLNHRPTGPAPGKVTLNGEPVRATFRRDNDRLIIDLNQAAMIETDDVLEVVV